MKTLATCLCLFVLASVARTQDASRIDSGNPDRIQIEQALQRYLGAYQRLSVQDLLTVWPDLKTQKKEYDRIKRHFEDPNISNEQLSLEPLQMQSTSHGATVYARRTEQYVKSERLSTSSFGDLRAGTMPGQDPGPRVTEKKKDFKKSAVVLIDLHRGDEGWTIVSIGEQKVPCCLPEHASPPSTLQTE